MYKSFLTGIVSMALLLGCFDPAPKRGSAMVADPTATNREFEVRGVVKEIKADGKTVVIRHEEIPNYMPAMVMPFNARRPEELRGLNPGDTISFRMTVTPDDVWIDQMKKEGASVTSTNSQPSSAAAPNEL